MWESLIDSDFCIKASEGFIDEDAIQITSGALVGKENLIKACNIRKRKAFLDIDTEFANELVPISVVLKLKKH